MSKININGISYDNLGNIKVNNREYIFVLAANDLDFFERQVTVDEIKYIPTNKDFTLEGNAGSSLMRLNERIVMNHIASELKNAIKIKKVSNLQDIEKELSLMQQVFDEEENLKKLFKGNVVDLDEEKFKASAQSLISYFDSKKKSKERESEFDIVEGGVDRTFINRHLYEELENKSIDEELSPTIIVDKLVRVDEAKVEKELSKKVPSTEIIGVKESELTDEIIETILEKKQDIITPEQGLYLEKILDSRKIEENVSTQPPVIDEPLREEKIEEPTSVIEDIKEVYEENKLPELEVEVPLDYKKLSLRQKKKPSPKAAYIDTVILCLLTQLGIFGILIVVLLLVK